MKTFVLRFTTFLTALIFSLLIVSFWSFKVTEEEIKIQIPIQELSKPDSQDKEIQQEETQDNLIVAGKSVGHLRLGNSRERAIELFGRLDTEYDYSSKTKLNCGNHKELRFLELKDKSNPFHFDYSNGAWVYLRDNKIEQIKIQSKKFKTSENLTVGSKPQQVRRYYPNIKTFVELNSQCECTGGSNLIFWIDKEKGIAFEFHYWRNVKARRLSYIYVFQPNTEFLPEGCVYLETQGWEEIEPFSLEEPKGMQDDWQKERAKRVGNSK